jgi:phenylpropionate dioxygenase-like ring-hydroxylating dioxygenase large terminal subunit
MTAAENQNTREARLVPFQDDNGFHLCIGFIKEVQDDGRVVFEEQGNIAISYGAYEIAIQDLEICLSQAKSLLAARKQALAEQAAAEPKA